jgi:hypothetical protein
MESEESVLKQEGKEMIQARASRRLRPVEVRGASFPRFKETKNAIADQG